MVNSVACPDKWLLLMFGCRQWSMHHDVLTYKRVWMVPSMMKIQPFSFSNFSSKSFYKIGL